MFVAGRYVADQAQGQRVGRLGEQLAAQGVVILVVVPRFSARARPGVHMEIAVARAIGEIEADGQLVVDQRPGHFGRTADRAIIADGEFGIAAEGELRLGGQDVDHAGGRRFAEQGALRTLQHLDPLDIAEIAEADAVARAIDAVDHHADRGFEAGIVADRADAADARRGGGFACRRGHQQARREQREILDVLHPGVLDKLAIDRRDHDRDVLQRLRALAGGDDDVSDIGGRGLSGRLRGRGCRRRGLRQGRHSLKSDGEGGGGHGEAGFATEFHASSPNLLP